MNADKKLLELAENEITSLPWEVHHHRHVDGEFWCTIGHDGHGPITDVVGAQGNKTEYFTPVAGMKYLIAPVEEQKANAEYIAAAANAVPRLIAENEVLLKRIEDLRNALGERRRDRHVDAFHSGSFETCKIFSCRQTRKALAADDKAAKEQS